MGMECNPLQQFTVADIAVTNWDNRETIRDKVNLLMDKNRDGKVSRTESYNFSMSLENCLTPDNLKPMSDQELNELYDKLRATEVLLREAGEKDELLERRQFVPIVQNSIRIQNAIEAEKGRRGNPFSFITDLLPGE